MADRQLKVTIIGDTKSLDRALGRTETRLSRFGRKVGGARGAGRGGLGGSLGGGALGGAIGGGLGKAGPIGAGIAGGLGLAVVGLKSVTSAAKEAEVAQALLKQAFAATGTSSVLYGRAIEGTIQRTSKLAGIDDELVSQSFANLLRTTGSVAKATRDVGLAADIARARHISLAAATKIVEKAENGQLRGLKSLGVQIDKNTTSTQAIEQAQRKFAGSAVAYGQTAAGAQDKLSVAFENLRERLGLRLLPLLTRVTLALVGLIDWSERNWPRFSRAVHQAYITAKPVIDSMVATIRAIGQVVRGVVNIISGIANGRWAQVWKGMKQVAVGQLKGIYAAFVQLPLKMAKALGAAAFRQVERAFTAIMNRLIDLANTVIGGINKFSPFADIPKIPKLGNATSPKKTPGAAPAATGKRPDEGTRGPIVVNLVVDGKQMASVVTDHQNKAARRAAPQSRGRQIVTAH